MAKIVLTALHDNNQEQAYEHTPITIGRAHSNDLVINDQSVSRHHAEISDSPKGYVLTNIGRFPIRVNKSPVEKGLLKDGDIISFSQRHFRFHIAEVSTTDETIIRTDAEETWIDSTPAVLTITDSTGHSVSHLIDKDRFEVGRSSEADVIIEDRHVSRKHFVIERRIAGYFLLKLSKSQAVLLNGIAVTERRLFNEDKIEFHTLTAVFKSTNQADQRGPNLDSTVHPDEITEPSGESTLIQTDVVAKHFGPRLALHSDKQDRKDTAIFALGAGETKIGRDVTADVCLPRDERISRTHAVIENREKGHVLIRKSKNPVLVNGKSIRNPTRIYNGDSLQFGDLLLTFLSDWPQDKPPVKTNITRIAFSAAVILVFVLGGLLIYRHIWQPWQIDNRIFHAEQQLKGSFYATALSNLATLYDDRLSLEQRSKVAELLALGAERSADDDITQGNLEVAQSKLIVFLKRFGGESSSSAVWEKLNEVRFRLAQQFQLEGKVKSALKEFLAINSDSRFYQPAQENISAIWLKAQEPPPPPEPETPQTNQALISSMLLEANALFDKKHFLTPLHNNAYAIYSQILSMDAENRFAIAKVEAIKDFYRTQGARLCQGGNRNKAETFFRRYLIIDPTDQEIQNRIDQLENCAAPALSAGNITTVEAGKTSATGTQSNQEANQNKAKVEQLLEQEGIESDWIIEYLFDNPQNETDQPDAETPW